MRFCELRHLKQLLENGGRQGAIATVSMVVLLAACTGRGTLTVGDAWVRPAPAGENTAVYFYIENLTGVEDRLFGVHSPASVRAEIHRTMIVETSGDPPAESDAARPESPVAESPFGNEVMQMMPLDQVEVPANRTIQFEPGGLHVMLLDLKQDLVEGESIRLLMQFEVVGIIQVEVPVENR